MSDVAEEDVIPAFDAGGVENGEEAATVGAFGGICDSCPVKQGGRDVGKGNEGFVDETGGSAGFAKDEGGANARFILGAHSAGFGSAVVGEEDDEGVIVVAVFFQGGDS